MDFPEYLNQKREMIDAELERLLPPVGGSAVRLFESMRYAVLGGGKRLRPVLCIAGYEVGGGNGAEVARFACGLEMIHAFSLVHDDLPCMDDDDLRRGKPTVHRKFGEAMAVLAGDALHNFGYRVMMDEALRHGGGAWLRAAADVAHAIGWEGVVAGQVVDVEMEGKPPDADALEFIHANKTAVFIRAAVRAGAMCGGVGEAVLEKLGGYSLAAGLLFQIVDDIMDETADAGTTGKNVRKDRQLGKQTYVKSYGLDGALDRAREMVKKAVEALGGVENSEVLRGFPEYVFNRIPETVRGNK